MPDGGDKPAEAARQPVEVAAMVLQWLHECASSSNPIANIAAIHLMPDQTFFDRIAAEFNISAINFRLFQRNQLIQELGKSIKENGPTLIARRLDREFAVHKSRHSELELSQNNYPPGSRDHMVHEVLRLNAGRALRWRMIYEILQLKL